MFIGILMNYAVQQSNRCHYCYCCGGCRYCCEGGGGGERRCGDGVNGGAAVEERVAIIRFNYSMKSLNQMCYHLLR